MIAAAAEPKRLWIVTPPTTGSATISPSSTRGLLEALAWVHERAATLRRACCPPHAGGCRSLLGLFVFAIALRVLRTELRGVSWHHLTADIAQVHPARLVLALVLTAINYAVLTGYDFLAFAYIGKQLPARAGRLRLVPVLRGLEQRRLRDALRRLGALPLLHADGA